MKKLLIVLLVASAVSICPLGLRAAASSSSSSASSSSSSSSSGSDVAKLAEKNSLDVFSRILVNQWDWPRDFVNKDDKSVWRIQSWCSLDEITTQPSSRGYGRMSRAAKLVCTRTSQVVEGAIDVNYWPEGNSTVFSLPGNQGSPYVPGGRPGDIEASAANRDTTHITCELGKLTTSVDKRRGTYTCSLIISPKCLALAGLVILSAGCAHLIAQMQNQ